jgi:hypothetical protein
VAKSDKRMVIFFSLGIGDHFMSTPALRALLSLNRETTLVWIPTYAFT